MPTFIFMKNGEKVGSVVGADPNKLKVRPPRPQPRSCPP